MKFFNQKLRKNKENHVQRQLQFLSYDITWTIASIILTGGFFYNLMKKFFETKLYCVRIVNIDHIIINWFCILGLELQNHL